MRIFLRNYQTGAFFKSAGNWTEFLVEGHEFPSADRAVEVAQELKLQKIEMVVIGHDGKTLLGTRLDIEP